MAKISFTWILLVVLIIWNVYNWRLGDGSASFFSFMIFWFYYEINNKDLQLRDINGKNPMFSIKGMRDRMKSVKNKSGSGHP